jgi:hypothetical protein
MPGRLLPARLMFVTCSREVLVAGPVGSGGSRF